MQNLSDKPQYCGFRIKTCIAGPIYFDKQVYAKLFVLQHWWTWVTVNLSSPAIKQCKKRHQTARKNCKNLGTLQNKSDILHDNTRLHLLHLFKVYEYLCLDNCSFTIMPNICKNYYRKRSIWSRSLFEVAL